MEESTWGTTTIQRLPECYFNVQWGAKKTTCSTNRGRGSTKRQWQWRVKKDDRWTKENDSSVTSMEVRTEEQLWRRRTTMTAYERWKDYKTIRKSPIPHSDGPLKNRIYLRTKMTMTSHRTFWIGQGECRTNTRKRMIGMAMVMIRRVVLARFDGVVNEKSFAGLVEQEKVWSKMS
mgnify:CR=1 FL=1